MTGSRSRKAIDGLDFDAVVDWVAFTPEQVRTDVELFRGRTRQYVFISSASAYQTPPARVPVVESTPLANPFWQYSRDKIACEDLLLDAYRAEGFPVTIVRPSHTYDRTSVPFDGGWTVSDRMRRGKEIVVHGDGTSLWTLTHHTDFARGFVRSARQPTHDRRRLPHHLRRRPDVESDRPDPRGRMPGSSPHRARAVGRDRGGSIRVWGAGLLGDKAHSMVFDNAKLRSVVPDYVRDRPFEQGAREIVEWHDANPARRQIDERLDAVMDTLIETYRPRT